MNDAFPCRASFSMGLSAFCQLCRLAPEIKRELDVLAIAGQVAVRIFIMKSNTSSNQQLSNVGFRDVGEGVAAGT